MDLPTYTNIWRIEKRLYKLYDFRLPMPLPINWIAVFAAITVPYIVFLIAIGLPFNHTLVWLYILPPGVLTWLTTRPVIENKRLPELVESQVRYLTEPRVWTRLTPHNEKDQVVVTARVWHIRQAPQRRTTAKTRAAMGAVALRERNALAPRGVASAPIGDPAEGNASLAAASALATAPATSANSRSRARARGTGPRIPAPGPSGRQRPPGKRTRPPQQDWAAQQREAARHDEFPEDTWPATQPPRAQTTGTEDTEDEVAKPSRFRLSALRPRHTGQAPALPPGVALRRPAEPRRPRFGSPPPSDQAAGAQPWPEGPVRPGQAGPAWRMPVIRSAPPLGSVAAPMSSDLPAHATPDIYPASPPPAADVESATSVYTAPDENQVPSVLAFLGAPVALASLEVATDTPVSDTTLDGEPAMSAPAAPEVDPAAEAPDTEPTTSAPASSEAHAAPSAPATPEVEPGASPAAVDVEPATWVHVVPEVDLVAPAAAASDVEPANWAPASSEADAAPATYDGELAMSAPPAPEVDQAEAPAASDVEPVTSAPAAPEVDPDTLPVARDGEPATSLHAASEVDQPAEAPVAPDAEPAIWAPASSEADAALAVPEADLTAQALAASDAEPATWAPLSSEADATPGTSDIDLGAPLVALDGEPATLVHVVPEVDPAAEAPAYLAVEPATAAPASSEADGASVAPDRGPATWVHVVPEVDPAAQVPAASDVGQAASARSPFQTRPAPSAPSASDLGPTAAPGLGNVRSTPAPAPSGAAPRVEISHDGPSQRLVPPAPVPPVNPALAWPSARPEPADLFLFSAALTTETGDKSQIPAAVPADEHAEASEVEAEEAEEAEEPRALEVVHDAVAAPQVPVVGAVADAEPPTVPPAVLSIERALSGPSKDRNLTWHGKVKIVAGTGQGPGKRDQEALDRARARLPLKTPQRVLMLGCTSGAGQSVTTLMTGHILASLRDEPVAAVDLHDGTLARYSAPAGWLEDMLSGRPPQGATKARPDGLGPTLRNVPARLDVIASHGPLRDGDELKLAAQLTRHYSLGMLDPGAAGLMKLLKIADQLVVVVPASIDGAGALADTRDWLDTHGFADLADHSVTVINGVSRRSLADVEHAESAARGRCRAIVRVPWDDMLPVEIADPSALRPQTRVAYTALAGVLVAGMAAGPVRTSQ